MGLNKIDSATNWGQAAADINTNFETIAADVSKVKDATTRNKGYFATAEDLFAALPSGQVGDVAFVGAEYPYAVYRWDGIEWANNGEVGGESVDLHEYPTKDELSAEISGLVVQETGDGEGVVMSQKAVTEKLSELESEGGIIKIDGDGVTPVKTIVHLAPNRKYRIYLVNDWLYTSDYGTSIFTITHIPIGATEAVRDYTLVSTEIKPQYIDITTEESVNSNEYYFNYRADVGETIYMRIQDVTEITDIQESLQEFGNRIVDIKTNDSTIYYEDGSFLCAVLYLTYANGENERLLIGNTFSPLDTEFSYVLTSNKTIETRIFDEIDSNDVILLSYNSSHVVYGGYLYADYIKKSIHSPFIDVWGVGGNYSTSIMFDEENASVSIPVLYGRLSNKGIVTIYVNQEFQFDGSGFLFLRSYDNVWVVEIVTKDNFINMNARDIMLLSYHSGIKKFNGGVLYPLFLDSKIEERKNSQTFWTGKKIVWTGDSISYGSGLADITKAYPYLVAEKLGASIVNYAIGGSIVAKGKETTWMNNEGAVNYDEVYLDIEEWNAAIANDSLDVSKKYLVKDNINVPTRPYHIYSYNGGEWQSLGDNSTKCGRTPIVDRIGEMDKDADLVVVACGTNDFYYMWSDFGDMESTDKTSFYGAMKSVCQYLVQTYINKQIVFINAIKRVQHIGESNGQWNLTIPLQKNPEGKTLEDYNAAMKEVCDYYSIPVVNLYTDGGLNPSFDTSTFADTDGKHVHPNVIGHERLASVVSAFLQTFRN